MIRNQKAVVTILAISISASSVFGFSLSNNVLVTMKQNGGIVFQNSYSPTGDWDLRKTVGSQLVNNFESRGTDPALIVTSISTSRTAKESGFQGQAETEVIQTQRLRFDTERVHKLTLAAWVESYSPNGSAEGFLVDEATGERLTSTGKVVAGRNEFNTKLVLQANRNYIFVSRTHSFVDFSSDVRGDASTWFGIDIPGSPVPEPGSMVLLTCAALAGFRRRRGSR